MKGEEKTVDLSEFMRRPEPGPCSVALAMMGLGAEDTDALSAAFAAPYIQMTGIVSWCKKRPATAHLGDGSLRKHRKRECTCYLGAANE